MFLDHYSLSPFPPPHSPPFSFVKCSLCIATVFFLPFHTFFLLSISVKKKKQARVKRSDRVGWCLRMVPEQGWHTGVRDGGRKVLGRAEADCVSRWDWWHMGLLSKYGREYGSQLFSCCCFCFCFFFTIRGEGVANRKSRRLDLPVMLDWN